MANGHGGKRAGSGPKRKRGAFACFAREIVLTPEVQAVIKAKALESADFALRLAEHGFGRPSQALHITDDRQDGVYRSELSDGLPLHPAEDPAELPN